MAGTEMTAADDQDSKNGLTSPGHDPPWQRRTELRTILALSGPIIISIGAYVVVEVVQVALLGHYRTEALSAASVALAWSDSARTFLTAGAVRTCCSQAYGAKKFKLVGIWLQVSLVVGTVLFVPVAIICMFARPVLELGFGFEGKLLDDAQEYCGLMVLAIFPQMIWERVTGYFQSIQVVVPETVAVVLATLLYIPLASALIYGIGSWHGLGVDGAPVGMAILIVLENVALYIYACRMKGYHRETWPGWNCLREVTRPRIVRFLKLYIPGVVQAGSELWRMQLINLWAGELGVVEAATQAAGFRIIYVVYVFVFSMSLATSSRVGQHLGAGHPSRAKTAANLGIGISMIFGVILGILISVGHRQFGVIFSNDEAVLSQLSSVSYLIALTQFFMTMADVFNPILNTQGRPSAAAVASGLTSWLLHVPCCWLLAFSMQRGFRGIWEGLLIGYFGQCALSGFFVWRSNWPEIARKAQDNSERTVNVVEGEETLEACSTDAP
eukprot:TRINITY_DN62416_c0_g1_i1.p1 TRINITY_DN62416_c0_g1~~TRINITY_DN62416_c0_g1_i1.p1  ORF type:complete len:499 (-),score=58.34 TRINITY_DN62416_c0_g1_i1:228-1724(-)